MIIEYELPAKQQLLFQAILQAEDGLAFVRCRDTTKKVQQLWTTSPQMNEVSDWLQSLASSFDVRILRSYTWSIEEKGR